MRQTWKPLAFVLAAVLVIALTQVEWSAEKTTKPPHHARLVGVPQEAPPDIYSEPPLLTYLHSRTLDAVTGYIAARAQADLGAYLIALTPPPAPVVAPAPVIAVEAGPTSLQPCGGDLPPCYVKMRESGGDYSARNNSEPGAACGAWQIIGSTWAGYGGYSEACQAPPAVQDAKARELWAGGAGCGHWSAC
jgi:hypothetical protein